MTCPQVQSLLEDYLDRELEPQADGLVARHLELCAACRSEMELSRWLRQALGQFRSPEPAADYWREVQSLILARTVGVAREENHDLASARRVRERASLYQSMLAVAASLVIFFSALWLGSTGLPIAPERADLHDQPLTRASLIALACANPSSAACKAEQERLARGMLLMGRPGLVGSSADLVDALGLK